MSVYNNDPLFANKVRALLDKYNVFRDRGIVPILEEQKIRINLVNGYQHQLKLVRAYPIGREDREFLDKEYNKMQAQGKLSFIDQPTPIAYLVFIV